MKGSNVNRMQHGIEYVVDRMRRRLDVSAKALDTRGNDDPPQSKADLVIL